MKGFQRILVPVDFSAHSAEAVRVAADLGRRFSARLSIVHVYDPLTYALPDGFMLVQQSDLDKLFEALRAQLGDAQRQALECGAPNVETKLLQGHVAGEVVDYAARGEFDLIVLGTHGRSGLQHLVLGSIAERVVRLAPCPVLTVKKPSSREQR